MFVAAVPPLPPPVGAIAPFPVVAFVPLLEVPADDPPPLRIAEAPFPPLYFTSPIPPAAAPPVPPVSPWLPCPPAALHTGMDA